MSTKYLAFQEFIKHPQREAFKEKVIAISNKLGIKPDWLMAVMWKESRIDPRAVNWQPGDSKAPQERLSRRATGLIQFMPTTAATLGTSTEALYNMDSLQQLDYVYKYYKPYAKYIKSYPDMYLATFYPVALKQNWSDETRFPAIVPKQNPGMFTVGDFKKYVWRQVPEKYMAFLKAGVGLVGAFFLALQFHF